jgi:hypothetical protein
MYVCNNNNNNLLALTFKQNIFTLTTALVKDCVAVISVILSLLNDEYQIRLNYLKEFSLHCLIRKYLIMFHYSGKSA